jgi:hypothetical protein
MAVRCLALSSSNRDPGAQPEMGDFGTVMSVLGDHIMRGELKRPTKIRRQPPQTQSATPTTLMAVDLATSAVAFNGAMGATPVG